MDIGSGTGFPSSSLSNFSPHPFEIDGIQCNSMEGFLQSLKFSNPEMQKEVCKMVGKQSQEYQDLITKAYDCLFKNEGFRKALAATNGCVLTHSIGKNKIAETVLTEREFIGQLNRLRGKL